jgi:hypothetical protein
MKHYINKILIFFAMIMLFESCKKTLDTESKNSLDLTFALSTREGLQATLISIYNALQGSTYYGRDFIVIPEVLSDNCEITSNNSNRFVTQANNTPGSHINIWANAYRNINRANLIIANVDNSAATAAEKLQWKGEAYFLRALLYSDLIRVYARSPLYTNVAPPGDFTAGVPIVKDPVLDATSITFPARSTVNEVYDFIIQDLTTANSLLTNSGVAYRPRKVAAQALMSRMELYRGHWSDAERWSDSVLTQGSATFASAATYFTLSTTPPSWGNGHQETIFGLKYETGEGTPGTDALQYIYYRNLPSIQGYADITTQTSLRTDMGVSGTPPVSIDQRFTKLVSVQTKSSQQVFFTMKWPGLKSSTVSGQDDIMILRTSEIVLNRAEARARQGGAKEALAIADINQTRTRAGLVAFPTSGVGAPTGTALITEVLKERRIELAYEGHRLFDLLRTGRDVIKSPANIAVGTNTYNYLIAPILQADIDVNTNLVKNPGY